VHLEWPVLRRKREGNDGLLASMQSEGKKEMVWGRGVRCVIEGRRGPGGAMDGG
jgi:hypothetical protein